MACGWRPRFCWWASGTPRSWPAYDAAIPYPPAALGARAKPGAARAAPLALAHDHGLVGAALAGDGGRQRPLRRRHVLAHLAAVSRGAGDRPPRVDTGRRGRDAAGPTLAGGGTQHLPGEHD